MIDHFCGAKPFSGWQFVMTVQGSVHPLSELLLHRACPPRYLFLQPLCLCTLDFVVQLPSCVQLFSNPWTAAHQAPLSSTISQSLFKFRSIESVKPSNHFILGHPLLLLPAVFPSIRVFSSESALHIRWPKDWNFSFSIRPSSELAGLIFFRIDRFDLLAVQWALKRTRKWMDSSWCGWTLRASQAIHRVEPYSPGSWLLSAFPGAGQETSTSLSSAGLGVGEAEGQRGGRWLQQMAPPRTMLCPQLLGCLRAQCRWKRPLAVVTADVGWPRGISCLYPHLPRASIYRFLLT